MDIKVIKNYSDYKAALEQLSELLDKKGVLDSKHENTVELLMLIIKDYEQKTTQPVNLDPIEAIKFRMEQMHLSKKDLIPFLGSLSKVSEILSGKRKLSISMIRKLHKGLDIPLESLLKEQSENSSDALDYNLFPLKEMQERGCFGKIHRKTNDLKEYAEELIKDFCKGYYPLLEQNIAYLRAPLHQRGKRRIDKYALSIWQICVLKRVEKLATLPKYKKEHITESWLRELIKLSTYADGPKLVKEYLGRYGIAFVIEPHYKRTFLDGAAMMFEERPIIALTLRHNRVDNFWFVLAHELAHLMKHINKSQDKMQIYIDDLNEYNQLDAIEKEADSIANEAIIPKKEWAKFKGSRKDSLEEIYSFAQKIHVNPAMIAGRIRREKNNYRLFSKLVCKPVSV